MNGAANDRIKKVLITGANFANKGAQSMLFITIDEVKKRFPEAIILFQTHEALESSNYCFEIANIDWKMMVCSLKHIRRRRMIVRFIKDCCKLAIGRSKGFLTSFKAIKQVRDVDMIIDISGFAIGEKWNKEHNERFIYKLQYAKNNNIPIYMMPQSIGPFNFEKIMDSAQADMLRQKFGTFLKVPQIIFAREKDGVNSLKSIGVIENVVLSSDLVLQNQGIDLANIYKNPPKLNLISIEKKASVALVPNFQCLRHGVEHVSIEIYTSVLEHIIGNGKEVYIIRHSNDDDDLCERLYKLIDSEHLKLINYNLSCLEYDYLIRQFEYVVGSRFHGIVHALRNNVPCIALGWAVKYQELMESVGLRDYVFDITKEISVNSILNAIDNMDWNLTENKEKVAENLKRIQKCNCFLFLDKL